MFFAPPQVKSLSRYSQFGLYLQPKHFLIMLGLAILVHAVIIGAYSLVPREEVMRIPVRVLNIKLGGGGGEVVQLPSPEPITTSSGVVQDIRAPIPSPVEPPRTSSKAAQTVVDKSFSSHNLNRPRITRALDKRVTADNTLSTPKQYVRVGNLAGGTGGGKRRGSNGRSLAGTPEGDAIIQRYEQTISLWMAQHKTYPEVAKQQGVEGDAIVRIRINREGRIISSSIDRSSGHPLIDEAVLTMVRDSNPVPIVPDDYPDGSQLEFLIPVSFRLQ